MTAPAPQHHVEFYAPADFLTLHVADHTNATAHFRRLAAVLVELFSARDEPYQSPPDEPAPRAAFEFTAGNLCQ